MVVCVCMIGMMFTFALTTLMLHPVELEFLFIYKFQLFEVLLLFSSTSGISDSEEEEEEGRREGGRRE